jgi:hypothetical protein
MIDEEDSQNPELDWITNGEIRVASEPSVPRYIFAGDGQAIEYLLPYPMHLVGKRNLEWKPIEYIADGVPISIEPPLSLFTPYQPEGWRLGNEAAEAFCSIVRIRTPPGATLNYLDGWKIVGRLLEWIRVKCRHYWVLQGFTGVGAIYRGTVITRQDKTLSLKNFAMYAPGVTVKPLDEEIWLSIRHELIGRAKVPLADSIYCDALLSIAARDEMKALLEAGVAAEVATTQLLIDVSSTTPDTASKAEFRRRQEEGDYPSFKEKLTKLPQSLGLQPATDFACLGFRNGWVNKALELYRLRNGVAHAGIEFGKPLTDAGSLIFAANATLEYCRAQRSSCGLVSYSLPQGTSSFEQTISCHGAFVDTSSSTFECLIQQ